MSKQSSNAQSGGIGVLGLLGVVFVVLKLMGITAVAEWSWWWVTAPFWGAFALAISIFTIFAIVYLVVRFFES